MTQEAVIAASVGLPYGLGCGLLYFTAVRRGVGLLVAGGSWQRTVFLVLCRLMAAVGGFALAAWFSPMALLGALAGFWGARGLWLHAARGAG